MSITVSNQISNINENTSLEEIVKIINNNTNAQQAIDSIQENIDFFSSKNFSDKLISELKIEKDKEKIAMILFILSFIYKINENSENISTNIAKIVEEYQNKLNSIIGENMV